MVGYVVDEGLSLVYPVLPLFNHLTYPRLRAQAQLQERVQHNSLAVLVHQVLEPLRSDAPQRARLRTQVPQHQLRRAAVRSHQLMRLLDRLTLREESHRHYLQTLAEHVAREGVPGAGGLSTDVALVPHGSAEGDDVALVEDRENDDHIVGVRASGVVGVVDEEAVAVFHLIVGVELEDAFDAFGVGAEVRRERESTDRRRCLRGR